MSAIEELVKTVLALPVEQRAVLAESLLDSLPPTGEMWSEAEELAFATHDSALGSAAQSYGLKVLGL